MKLIKFNQAGKWAENNTLIPQFTVKEGDEHDCSDELAKVIVDAEKGRVIEPEVVLADTEESPEIKALREDALKLIETLKHDTKDYDLELDSERLKALIKNLQARIEENATSVADELKACEQLTADATALISKLGLDVGNFNLGLDSEGLKKVVADLTSRKELADTDAGKGKGRKTPATKDKGKAESK